MKNFITLLVISYSLFSTGQPLKPIPNVTYWNTEYDYKFHFEKHNEVLEEPLGYMGSWEDIHLAIQRRIQKQNEGVALKSIKTEQDLRDALDKLVLVFKMQTPINLDYYYRSDKQLYTVLQLLHNVYESTDTKKQIEYIEKANSFYDKLPDCTITKVKAYIFLSITKNDYYRRNNHGNKLISLYAIDSSAYQMYSQIKQVTTEDLVSFLELMGDYWHHNYYYKESLYYYQIAQSKVQVVEIWERIAAKIFWDSHPSMIRSNSYSKLNENIRETSNYDCALEFKRHHDLQEYGYRAYFNKGSENEYLYRLKKSIFANDSTLLPYDFFETVWYLNSKQKEEGDYLKTVESANDLIQIVSTFKICRTYNPVNLLQGIFNSYLRARRYQEAKIVNSYFDKLKDCIALDEVEYKSQVNNIQILYSRNEQDSVMKSITTLLLVEEKLGTNEKTELYELRKTLAYQQNDIASYLKYAKKIENLSYIDRAKDFGALVEDLTNFKRNETENVLNQQIEYLNYEERRKELLIETSKQIAQKSQENERLQIEKRNISDSLRISDSISNTIIQRLYSDTLNLTQQLVASERKEKFGIAIGFILLITTTVIIVGLWLKAKNSKVVAETQKVHSEKIQLEMESLKIPYLGHAIGNNFQYITNKIILGGSGLDSPYLKSAEQITKQLSNLFLKISQESIGDTNLWDEIQNCILYVKMISECEGKTINCPLLIDEELAKSIIVPKYFLLDFYINSTEHGQVAFQKNGYIKTTLSKGLITNEYLLQIEDNGKGKSSKDLITEKRHSSSGLDRVMKRLNMFNKENHSVHIFFDKHRDISYKQDENESGTIIIIKIQFV